MHWMLSCVSLLCVFEHIILQNVSESVLLSVVLILRPGKFISVMPCFNKISIVLGESDANS